MGKCVSQLLEVLLGCTIYHYNSMLVLESDEAYRSYKCHNMDSLTCLLRLAYVHVYTTCIKFQGICACTCIYMHGLVCSYVVKNAASDLIHFPSFGSQGKWPGEFSRLGMSTYNTHVRTYTCISHNG